MRGLECINNVTGFLPDTVYVCVCVCVCVCGVREREMQRKGGIGIKRRV